MLLTRAGRLLALTVPVSLLGCGGTEQAASPPGYVLVMTEAGHPWARNSADPGESTVWRAILELSIGAADGPGADVFGSIESLDVSVHGLIAVLDGMAQEVRVFDPSGQHVRTFGQPGEGPGEFGFAAGVLWQGDSLWVFDARKQVAVLFDDEGEFARQVASPNPVAPLPIPSEIGPDGGLLAWRFENVGRDYSVPAHAGPTDVYQPVFLDPLSGAVDTLPGIRVDVDRVEGVRVPLGGLVAMAPSSDGSYWFSHPTDYVLYHREAAGDTVLVVSLDNARPVPIRASERDSIARAPAAATRRLGQGARAPSADDVPASRRFVERILPNGEGDIYVLARVESNPDGYVLDVFDVATGRYHGRAEMPVELTRASRVRAAGTRIYAGLPGELDVPYVVRLRVERE